MTQQKDHKLRSSFTLFNQLDDRAYLEYLEDQYPRIHKQHRKSIQKEKINFFIDQEIQTTQTKQYTFQQNFCIPSLRFFSDIKEMKVEAQNQREIQGKNSKKNQQTDNSKTYSNSNHQMIFEQINPFSQSCKLQQELKNSKIGNLSGRRRLKQIISHTQRIKEGLHDIMLIFQRVLKRQGRS